MRSALAILAWLVLMSPQGQAQHGTIDADESLLTVMAAINAAGYDADIDSPTNHPIREQVRRILASQNLESVEKLKQFYREHETGSPVGDLSQYISYALASKGPPTFEFEALDYELPPDVQPLLGLSPLLAEFYREADIPELYQQIQPAIDEIAARYQGPVTRSLFELNGYLRNPTSGVSGRSFRIIISLLAAPNQIQTRSYSSNYFIVVSPAVEPQIEDIRYTYLHYILESVANREREELERVRPLGDYALGAPYLPEHYKQDFQLLATSSLIKAIEARLLPAPPRERQAAVDKAYRQGYVLAPAFYEQLSAYEQQDTAMRLYFKEMLKGIDLAQEEARARELEFDQERAVRLVKPAAPPEPKLSQAEKTLQEAEELYRDRDLDGAGELFRRAVSEARQRPIQARAYYGLARIATLENDPELALSLYERALSLGPDDADKAWILFYLGRLSDLAGEAGKASDYYRAALAVDGVSSQVRKLAEEGAAGQFRAREP